MDFTPSGDLLQDLQNCIDHQNTMEISYLDRKGNSSTRKILPLEIRGDRFYAADLDKMGLRLFILSQIGTFTVLDEQINKDSLTLT